MRLSRRYLFVALASTLPALLSSGCRASPEPPRLEVPADAPFSAAENHLRVLEQVDGLLTESYLFPETLGGDWERGVEALRRDAESGVDQQTFSEALVGLLNSLPDGTVSYVTRDERIASAVEGAGAYEGIGAFVAYRASPTPRLVLLSVVEGSPARDAGLKAHDSIHAIDGTPVSREEGASAVERVRGEAGTSVRLEVESPGGPRRTVSVTRRQVVAADEVIGRVMSTGAVHLLVPVRADETLIESVAVALDALRQEPDASGLVLDLRIAASGGSWPLEEMLSLFTDGDLGGYVDREGEGPLVIRGRDANGSQSVPLVVLVGPDTSGAPEVFAAAIQETRRGVVVGQATSGGVFGFRTVILLDGSQLSYVRSSFTTPLGRDLGREGVVPNLVVPSDWDQVTDTRDPVLGTALALLSP